MMKHVTGRLVGLAAALLLAVGVSQAGFQGRDAVCWLGTGGWQLREDKEGAYLVECRWDRTDLLPREKRHRWYVSAPTIKAESGKLLGYDPKGRDPSVRLVSDKGASSTRWLFEIVSRLRPEPSKARWEEGLKKGGDGFTFRVMAAEGPYRHWYLAAEGPAAARKEGKAKGTARRRLKLVRGQKQATVFEYVQENYFVGHR
jgi:hypothetical protein